jgi:beta-galactosidase
MTPLAWLRTSAAAVLAGVLLNAAPGPFFPVAVWYGGGTARAPMVPPMGPGAEAAWRKDLAAIKALGFNTVRTWVEWSAAEAREGEYRFGQLDLLLTLAEQAGLKVIVQAYVDSAPEWVGRKFPDGQFVTQGGIAIRSQAAPGYCFDHPGVRRAVLAFFEAVARRASASPAFYAYDLWSEPAVMNWALPAYVPNAQYCYCPHSIARFRDWLRTKHGSLERLNQAWYRTFSNWDEVEPPRFGTILTYADFMDWRVYIGEKIAADLNARAGAVRSVDTAHPATSHAPNPSPVFRTLADAMDASDDYLMKDSVDLFGTSFYPKLTSPDRDFPLERRALVLDMARAVTGDRGFYIGEMQAGYGVHGTVTGNPITPDDLELYAWGAVARGARSISFYAYYPMSTGYEAGGYGLINLDGSPTDRSRRAGGTARALDANADLILASRPFPAQVAVVFNPLVPLLGGEQAYGDRRAMHRAVAGYHRMFFERNVAVDFPSAREITAESLRPYALVILPCPILLTEPMAAALERYVRDGGHLFVEARPGWQDERGHASATLPGFGWDRLLGVRETEVLPVTQVAVDWGGRVFGGMSFAEHFEPVDPSARVVARFRDGAPAAFERAAGKGRAIILGTFAGERNAVEPVAMHPLGDLLIEWAGVARPALESSGFVELRRLHAPAGELVLLFNHAAAASRVRLEIPLARPPRAIRELVTGEAGPPGTSGQTGAQFRLDAEIPGQRARVYRIDF